MARGADAVRLSAMADTRKKRTPFTGPFYSANVMEIFERLAWYGFFAIAAVYLTDPTSKGGLGFTDSQQGERKADMVGIDKRPFVFTPYRYHRLSAVNEALSSENVIELVIPKAEIVETA